MQQNGAIYMPKVLFKGVCQEYSCDANINYNVKGHDKRSRLYVNIQ